MASSLRARMAGTVQKLVILAALAGVAGGGWALIAKESGYAAGQQVEVSYRHRSSEDQFAPAAAQWTTLGIEPVSKRLRNIEVNTYFATPGEPLLASVQFATLEDGTKYPRVTTLEAPSKQLSIRIENAGFSLAR